LGFGDLPLQFANCTKIEGQVGNVQLSGMGVFHLNHLEVLLNAYATILVFFWSKFQFQ
jgi:hypothetical protein